MRIRDAIGWILLALLFGVCLGIGRAAGHDLMAYLLGAS